MIDDHRIGVVLPAVNEAEAIGPVLDGFDRSIVDVVVVGDNGSTDDTVAVARAHGATVVIERRRGYGSACLAALATDEIRGVDIVVFLDADGSDDPNELPLVVAPIVEGQVDLVIGSRVLGDAEAGALTPVQRFGNWLTCRLVRRFWGVEYTDLGPFRAITQDALTRLDMADPDFGWTIEMQVKAAEKGLRVTEVPVSRYVRQAGVSKVSGSISGSAKAGMRILSVVFASRFG